jgi:hypothetical protein
MADGVVLIGMAAGYLAAVTAGLWLIALATGGSGEPGDLGDRETEQADRTR